MVEVHTRGKKPRAGSNGRTTQKLLLLPNQMSLDNNNDKFQWEIVVTNRVVHKITLVLKKYLFMYLFFCYLIHVHLPSMFECFFSHILSDFIRLHQRDNLHCVPSTTVWFDKALTGELQFYWKEWLTMPAKDTFKIFGRPLVDFDTLYEMPLKWWCCLLSKELHYF